MQVDDNIQTPPSEPTSLEGFHRLPGEALTAELLGAAILWAVVSIVGIVGGSISLFTGGLDAPWIYLLIAFGWLVFTAWCFGWTVLSHRFTSYRVSESGLEIKRGVLWRRHHFVPRSRVQHSDINQGPFQRRLGISKLVVYTAGSARHTTALTGVTQDEAREMRTILTGHGGDDDGV